ncbi:MAG: putative cysteine dioxygenase [Humibacillus sp.]|nr:putative cysteine dioxygenase [Humibacillus sp.]
MSTKTRTTQTPTTGRTLTTVADTARRLAGDRSLWSHLVDFDPISRYYARIVAEEGYEAWLLTWLPGQGTDWHDHGESAGSFVVLQGELTERLASAAGADGARRADAAVAQHRPGEQRTFGRGYVHQVSNHGPDPAVSLHVYAPRLTVMTTYDLSGRTLRPNLLQEKGIDW